MKILSKFFSFFKESELLKKSSISLFLYLIGGFIGYLFLILVTRNIGASAWGLFVLFLAILNISSIFGKLGLDTLIIKLVSSSSGFDSRLRKVYFSSFRFILFFSSIVSVIIYLLSDIIAIYFFNDISHAEIINIVAYAVPIFSLVSLNENTFRGLKMIKEFAFFQKVSKFLFSSLIFISLFYILKFNNLKIPIISYIVSLSIVLLITQFLLLKEFKFIIKQKKYLGCVKLLKQSFPTMLSSGVLLLMSWVDSLMIGSFISEYEVGVYNVALRVAMITSITLNAVNSISAPKISETFNNGRFDEFNKVVKKTTKTIFYFTIPIALVIILFPNFILGLFGSDFTKAKIVLLILVFSNIINSLSGSVGIIFNMTGKEKVFRNIISVSLLLNIFLNLLLIPKYKIEGAAISSAISLIFWNLYSVYYIYKNYGILTIFTFRND